MPNAQLKELLNLRRKLLTAEPWRFRPVRRAASKFSRIVLESVLPRRKLYDRAMGIVEFKRRVGAACNGSTQITLLTGILLLTNTTRAGIEPADWHKASIHGHKMYYAEQGKGPTLLFLHGGGDSGEHSFARQIDVFADRYHIVAPDQVGQGRTPDVRGPLTYTGMMEDTAALLHHLNLRRVDVVGFSDGGILALMLAVRHPELVRRLVISGVNIAPEGLNAEDLDELRATENPKPKTIDEKLAHLWANSPSETELNVAMLAKIDQPVLVISGDRDAITLEHTLTIFHALPDAELCVLPGTDHATFRGRSEWLNPIINSFLDRPIEPR